MRGRTPQCAAIAVAAALLLASASGCSSSSPVTDAVTEATVKGTITWRKKPITQGVVKFKRPHAERGSPPLRTAEIHRDGSYEVTVPVGRSVIEASGPKFYVSKEFEVKEGTNRLDITLP